MDATIKLISYIRQQDARGVMRDNIPIERETFCEVSSVSQQETFSGGLNGLRPELRFTINAVEYNGEKELEYNCIKYSIYRIWHDKEKDEIELYTERKVGV